MSRDFKLEAEFVPFIGIGIGMENNIMDHRIIVLIPFITFTITNYKKRKNEL
tara:strand:+ start:202 stop:357 length:156 start_codon:yes stop_codon:yes gene_type:complete